MSTIVCLVEPERLVLGTDSRFMQANFRDVLTDSMPKIVALDGGNFIACTGWSSCIQFQEATARTLAGKTADIRELAGLVADASRDSLMGLVATLDKLQATHPRFSETLAGKEPLQGFMLAGRSKGKLGYIYTKHWWRDGGLCTETTEFFAGERRHIKVVNDGPTVHKLAKEAGTWKDDAILVVRKFLAAQREDDPFIGGPDQIALIHARGSQWVFPPPQADLAAGAIRAEDAAFAAAAIQTADIADAAITTAKIGDAQITTAKIGDAQITNAKIVSLSASKISAGTIDASSITVTNLNATNITTGTLNGSRIGAGSITGGSGGHLANLTITDANIANATITSAKIASLDANKINAGTINVGSGGITITGSGGLTINTGSQVFTFSGTTLSAGDISCTTVLSSGLHLATEYRTGSFPGTVRINTSGAFVGAGVAVGTNGIGGGAFGVWNGSSYSFGATQTVVAGGVTFTFNNGIFMSAV